MNESLSRDSVEEKTQQNHGSVSMADTVDWSLNSPQPLPYKKNHHFVQKSDVFSPHIFESWLTKSFLEISFIFPRYYLSQLLVWVTYFKSMNYEWKSSGAF